MANPLRCVCSLAIVLGLTGCVRIETRVQLQPDGSATITEQVEFSQTLLELGNRRGGDLDVAALLEKEAVLKRMGQMGKGISLVSHEVRSHGGAREAVSVFKIPDISDFRYVSPFLGFLDYPQNNGLKCRLFPVYESTWYGREAGQMAVAFSEVSEHKPERQPKEGEPLPPGPSPAQLQVLRDLQPIFRDMLAGFHVRITFESYAPIRMRPYFRYRNQAAGTHSFDLIDVSDKSLDPSGSDLLANQEVMLELLRGQFRGDNLLAAVREHGTDSTLAVYHPRDVPEIYFAPSREMFNAYFQGKTLTFDKNNGGARPARWEEIGYKPQP